ncbi:unnamed protein product, partial [Pleuronectes platessa]
NASDIIGTLAAGSPAQQTLGPMPEQEPPRATLSPPVITPLESAFTEHSFLDNLTVFTQTPPLPFNKRKGPGVASRSLIRRVVTNRSRLFPVPPYLLSVCDELCY